jgi:hypothetical protein
MAQTPPQANIVKIRVTINGTAFTGTLNDDNPAAKDFLSLLPLTATLEDYAATEKITTKKARHSKFARGQQAFGRRHRLLRARGAIWRSSRRMPLMHAASFRSAGSSRGSKRCGSAGRKSVKSSKGSNWSCWISFNAGRVEQSNSTTTR